MIVPREPSLVERLRDISGWKEIVEKYRRKTDDPSITYVLRDGTRIHEDDSIVAKLAASLSRALEDASDVARQAADALEAPTSPSRQPGE